MEFSAGVTDVHSVQYRYLRTYQSTAEYVVWMGVAAARDTSDERPPLFKRGPNVSHLISSIKGVVEKCLNFDPEERPDAATIVEELNCSLSRVNFNS